jgi:hypothetical protein
MGAWVKRKSQACAKRKAAAEKTLKKVAVPEGVLREQWAAQVKQQTQKLERMSQVPHIFTSM